METQVNIVILWSLHIGGILDRLTQIKSIHGSGGMDCYWKGEERPPKRTRDSSRGRQHQSMSQSVPVFFRCKVELALRIEEGRKRGVWHSFGLLPHPCRRRSQAGESDAPFGVFSSFLSPVT